MTKTSNFELSQYPSWA